MGVSRGFFSLLLSVCGLTLSCPGLAASVSGEGDHGQPLATAGTEGQYSLQGSAEKPWRDSKEPDLVTCPHPGQGGDTVTHRSARHLNSLNPNFPI